MVKFGTTMNLISEKSLRQIEPIPLDRDLFRPFGQVIYPTPDGKLWDDTDARLELDQGVPRLYIMTLEHGGLTFDRITRHQRCTQCLGAIGGEEWFLGVARPDIPPDRLAAEDITLWRIVGHCLIKLELGTWHAGPFFQAPRLNFFNLELSDTNVTDHFSVTLAERIAIH
jgi:hypothetical protein